MADAKISALTDGTTANGTDQIPVARAGANKYITPTYLQTFLGFVSSILAVANGGTGSAYFTVAGPTTARTYTFPDAAASIGYLGIPFNSQSGAYTTVLSDAGKCIYHPSTDNNARTFTIDSNANVAYPIGTALTFINEKNTVTIAITTDTMTLAGGSSTGSRTLATVGVATAVKTTATTWVISGTGLT